MIWQFLAYGIAVSAALGVVGLCCERLAALQGWPRRMVWAIVIASCVLGPAAAVLMAEPRVMAQALVVEEQPVGARIVERSTRTDAASPGSAGAVAPTQTQARSPSMPAADPGTALAPPPLWRLSQPSGAVLLGMWAAVSVALWLHLLGAAVLLRRRAASWQRQRVLGQDVLVSTDTGPALFGAWRPRIVVPQWFLELSAARQALILAHERQHLLARDPLLLRAAQLAVAAMPWNLPLWWQLRRLRMAMELDCDARVLRGGADVASYGRMLLGVAQRTGGTPFGAVAMSRPLSVLEYRIRHLAPPPARRAALQAAGATALAAAGVAVAMALEAPALPTRPAALPVAAPRLIALESQQTVQHAPAISSPAIVATAGQSVPAGAAIQPEPAHHDGQPVADASIAAPQAAQSASATADSLLPAVPLELRNPAAVADRAVAALAAAHPELVDGVRRGGWYSGAVVLRMDGSVFRTALLHADDRAQAIRDILDLRYIPTGTLAQPALRVPGARGRQIPMEARKPGDLLADGRVLGDNLIFQYAVLPARTDESRLLLAVWEAVLARHEALLLPRDAGFANRLTVLLTDDGRIARERVELGPRAQMLAGPADFDALGVGAGEIGVWGTTLLTRNDYSDADTAPADQQVMRAALASALGVRDELLVHYAWPRREGEPAVGQGESR